MLDPRLALMLAVGTLLLVSGILDAAGRRGGDGGGGP